LYITKGDDDNTDLEGGDFPLFILFDCETTGFSIYSDHITEIGAKVIASLIPIINPTFSSLVRTARNIPGSRYLKLMTI